MAQNGFAGFKPAVFLVALSALAAVSIAEFAQTTVYFNVPVRTSFTVTLPLSAVTNASGASSIWTADATADINFSTGVTGANQIHVQPCLTTAFGGACQTGPAVPIFQYKNTGTVNLTMWLLFNDTLPTGVVVGMNSTRNTTTGFSDTLVHTDLYSLNSTAGQWAQAFSGLNTTSGQYVNVTLYANFTDVAGGLYVRLLAHNSTQGTLG